MLLIGCYRNNCDERAQFETYSRMAEEGMVEEIEYCADISVCVQQVFSLLYGRPGGLRWEELREILSPLCDTDTLKAIIVHLADMDMVIESHGRYRATTKLMDMGYKGFIHSNILQSRDFRVMDAATGRVIGELLIKAALGSHFVLSGKVWQVLQIRSKQKQLIVSQVGPLDSLAHFTKRFSRGAFSSYLPQEVTLSEN